VSADEQSVVPTNPPELAQSTVLPLSSKVQWNAGFVHVVLLTGSVVS